MSRCDFFTISQLLLRAIYQLKKINQPIFIEKLFGSFLDNSDEYSLDNGSVNHWINGKDAVSPQIVGYYLDEKNRGLLAEDIQNNLFPLIYDLDKVAEEAYNLVQNDFSISEKKKAELISCYPFESPDDVADYLSDILLFAMSRNFISRKELEKQSGLIIPVVTDMIYVDSVPKPCKYFCGRDKELEELHNLFLTNSKIFIKGVAGIGKSELSKAFASKFKRDYATILFLSYNGSLLKMIADMDFADDKPEYDEQTRFKLHNRYLRALKNDTLIIIDNFNTSANNEKLLNVVMKYNCNIIFTARSLFDCGRTLELKEIESIDTLVDLSSKFYSETLNNRDNIVDIIDVIHRHTLSVELSARLLQKGLIEPAELLEKLKDNSVNPHSSDKIKISKDGLSIKDTYFNHLHTLFSLYLLDEEMQTIMRCMAFVPFAGIRPKLFAKWLNLTNLNDVNDLVELGFIKEDEGAGTISLLPIIRDICFEDLKPDYSNCADFVRSIHEICLRHGEDILYANTLFSTVENIIKNIVVDDIPTHLLFMQDCFAYMEKYRYESGIRLIAADLKKFKEHFTDNDLARLYYAQSACVGLLDKDYPKAIELCKKAVAACAPEENTVLAANLYMNLGVMYQENKQFNLAKANMKIAVSILTDANIVTNDAVVMMHNCSRLLAESGDVKAAIASMEHAVKFLKENGFDNNSDYADFYLDIGGLYLYLKNQEAANLNFRKAFRIYSNNLNEDELRQKMEIAQNYFKRAGISSMPDYLETVALPE